VSGIKKGHTIDSLNFGDFISDPVAGLQQMFQGFFSSDEFNGETDFAAVVISQPKAIEPFEYKTLGYSDGANKSNKSFSKFKVRITHKAVNPHAILEDPCDITLAADRCQQNALIAAHTTIATTEIKGINIGSYVMIRLSKNPDGTYNLQTANLLKVIHSNETGDSTLTALTEEACASIKTYFEFGESYIPPPPIEITSGLRELAQRYDRESIPGKTTPVFAGFKPHKAYVSGGPPPAVKQPFDIWLKALIVVANDLGLKVQITSGFRTQQQQEKLHQDYKSGKSKIIAACGTCSRHISGFAVDLNLIDASGNTINSKSGPNVWNNTRLPATLKQEPFFLTWGGDFAPYPKNYDPIHFELNPKDWGDKVDEILDQQNGTNRNYDTESTGGFTNIEMEGFDNRDDQTKEETTVEPFRMASPYGNIGAVPSAIAAAAAKSTDS